MGLSLTYVEIDDRGRLLLRKEIRERFSSKRLLIRWKGDRIELIPVPSFRDFKGKFPVGSIEELEELQERAIERRDE